MYVLTKLPQKIIQQTFFRIFIQQAIQIQYKGSYFIWFFFLMSGVIINIMKDNSLNTALKNHTLTQSVDLSKIFIKKDPSKLSLLVQSVQLIMKNGTPEYKSTVSEQTNSSQQDQKSITSVSLSKGSFKTSTHMKVNQSMKEKIAQYKQKIYESQQKLDKIKNHTKTKEFLKKNSSLTMTQNTSSPMFDNLEQTFGKDSLFQKYSDLFKQDGIQSVPLLSNKLDRIGQQIPQKNNRFSLQIGHKEQKFNIIRYMDQGSTAKVFLVQHLKTGLILCLKVISKSSLPEGCFKTFIQEIKIQSAMDHPHIVNIYGYTADAQKIYLLLQPCLGSNIYKQLSKGPLKEKDVKKYTKQLCMGIGDLHKRDVIHRDIKAENVLLHQDTVKLCDFGWAVHAPMLRNTTCGTPLYTAPEIVKNQYYSSKVDIWGIGVLTYEMLYGMGPFEIRHPNDLCKIVEEEIFFSKEVKITESAKDFISQCLKKDPKERITIKKALQHDFLTTKYDQYRHTHA